jgi:hypothetical protein
MKAKILPILMTFILLTVLLGLGYYVLNFLPRPGNNDPSSAFSQYSEKEDPNKDRTVEDSKPGLGRPTVVFEDIMEDVIDPLLENCKQEFRDSDQEVYRPFVAEVLNQLAKEAGLFNEDGTLRKDRAFEIRAVNVGENFCSFALIQEEDRSSYIFYQKSDGTYEKVGF